MALKSTSSPIVISTGFEQGAANTFGVQAVDLQLNPLDQEVFVVTAVKIDFDRAPFCNSPLATDTVLSVFEVSVCKSRPNTMQSMSSSNVIASDQFMALTTYDGAAFPIDVALHQNSPMDSPPSQLDYLDIIATDQFFIATDGANTTAGSDGSIRIFGYRARADAATYAALVQSEMLSA